MDLLMVEFSSVVIGIGIVLCACGVAYSFRGPE